MAQKNPSSAPRTFLADKGPAWVGAYLSDLERIYRTGADSDKVDAFVAAAMVTYDVDGDEMAYWVYKHVEDKISALNVLYRFGDHAMARIAKKSGEETPPDGTWSPYLRSWWDAPNGVRHIFLQDLNGLMVTGYSLGNGLRRIAESRRQSALAASGVVQFVTGFHKGDLAWSAEVVPGEAGPTLRSDVTAPRIAHPSVPACLEAFEAMAAAVSDGSLKPGLTIRGDRFVAA